MFFLISKAITIQNSLSNEFRVSKMPNKVEQQFSKLQIAIEHSDEVFIEKLLLTYKILLENKFINLANTINSQYTEVIIQLYIKIIYIFQKIQYIMKSYDFIIL